MTSDRRAKLCSTSLPKCGRMIKLEVLLASIDVLREDVKLRMKREKAGENVVP